MRSRLLTSIGALALALGGLLVSAGPASAYTYPNLCALPTPTDLYIDNGSISFKSTGTNIFNGPSPYCSIVGLGYSSHGINVYCAYENTMDATWLYVVDTTTGVAGWVGPNGPYAFNRTFNRTPSPPYCYSA
jgi:hypothetical protein